MKFSLRALPQSYHKEVRELDEKLLELMQARKALAKRLLSDASGAAGEGDCAESAGGF